MLLFLTLLIPFLYFYQFWFPAVWSPNEAFYADSTRRMLQSGDFITPYYNGELRLEKPPMTYWLVALGYWIFGVNELGLRFMHVLLALLTGVLTALMAYELTKDKRTALLSFGTLTLSIQFFANGHYASPEIPFTFFITLSLFFWLLYYTRGLNAFLLLAFISSSFAMLVKGIAGFVLPAGVVFFYLLFTNPKELLKLRYYTLTLLALALGLWWHIYQFATKGEVFWKVFYKENIARIIKGKEPFYFYLLDMNVSFLPYSFLFFFALAWALIKVKRELGFFVVWFAFVYGVFSLVKSKIPVYVLPAFPALSVLTSAFVLSHDWQRIKNHSSLLISLLLSLAIVVGTFYFSLSYALLLLSLLPLLVFFKDYRLSPLAGGIALVLFLKLGIAPYLEEKRKVKELGFYIRELDPSGSLPTYQVGGFNHSLPFYAERRIYRNVEPKKGSIVVYREGTFEGCEPKKSFVLYTGSESRLFKFLLDSKKNKNFSTFFVCLY